MPEHATAEEIANDPSFALLLFLLMTAQLRRPRLVARNARRRAGGAR